jgi:hypothetical protein
MFRDRPRIRNQVHLAAFDEPSDFHDAELLRILRVWLGSRGIPHFVILAITIGVISGRYLGLDLIPRDIHASLPLVAFVRVGPISRKRPGSHFEK